MKIIFIFLLIFSANFFAQEFTVEKITGKVQALKGTSEKWLNVKTGDKLNGNDLISTEENSSVQLSREGKYFLLRNNSALGLHSIKNISINELLLALTLEEVRNVPKNSNPKMHSTAAYGAEVSAKNEAAAIPSKIGMKRINGAKQLAESGYAESAILFAKETFRKYPETAASAQDRIYFAKLLESLNLFEEALSEYSKIKSLNLNREEKEFVKGKLEQLTLKSGK